MKRQYKDTGYYVDTEGNVYGKRVNKLKPNVNRKGYLRVSFSTEIGQIHKVVHRLVAELFIPNPDNLPEVNHIDGDKTNNRVENLEWVSTKDNKRHAMDVLGHGFGETHSQATLTTEQVEEICQLIEDKYRTVDIARITEVDIEKIRCIRKGGAWKHISKNYNFPKNLSDHGMSDETFLWICHRLEEGLNSTQIMEMYTGGCKLSKGTISHIRRRKTRPHLSKNFNF